MKKSLIMGAGIILGSAMSISSAYADIKGDIAAGLPVATILANAKADGTSVTDAVKQIAEQSPTLAASAVSVAVANAPDQAAAIAKAAAGAAKSEAAAIAQAAAAAAPEASNAIATAVKSVAPESSAAIQAGVDAGVTQAALNESINNQGNDGPIDDGADEPINPQPRIAGGTESQVPGGNTNVPSKEVFNDIPDSNGRPVSPN